MAISRKRCTATEIKARIADAADNEGACAASSPLRFMAKHDLVRSAVLANRWILKEHIGLGSQGTSLSVVCVHLRKSC